MTQNARFAYVSVTIPNQAWQLARRRGWRYTVKAWIRHRSGWQMLKQGQHQSRLLYWRIAKRPACTRSFGTKRVVLQLGLRAPEGWLHAQSKQWLSTFTTLRYSEHTLGCGASPTDRPPGSPQTPTPRAFVSARPQPDMPRTAPKTGHREFDLLYAGYQRLYRDRDRYKALRHWHRRWKRSRKRATLSISHVVRLLHPLRHERYRVLAARFLATQVQRPLRVKELSQLLQLFRTTRTSWRWKVVYAYCRNLADPQRIQQIADAFATRKMRRIVLRRCR